MRRFFEALYPFAGGLLAAAGLACLAGKGVVPRDIDQLLNVGTNVGGVLAGFTLTAKSVVVSAPESSFLKSLAQAGAINGLLEYMMQSVYTSLLLLALSVALIAAPEHCTTGPYGRYVMSGWSGLFVASWLSVIRVAILFGRTMRRKPNLQREHPKV